MVPIPEEGDAHEAMAHRHGDVRAGGRGVHRRRRQQRAPSAIDTGSGASHAPVTLQMWGAWTGTRAPAVQQDLRRVHGEVPVDHGEQRGWRGRPEDHRRDQRRQPAGRRAVVRAGQRRAVLRVGRMAGPEPVHRAERLRRQPVPAVGRGVHELRRQPVRVPVPDRRLRVCTTTRTCSRRPGIAARPRRCPSSRTTRRSSRSSTPTARSRSPGSSRGSATTSSRTPTWGTSSARSGTTTTAPRRWSPPTRLEGDVRMAEGVHR